LQQVNSNKQEDHTLKNPDRWWDTFCTFLWPKVNPQQNTEEGQGLVEYALILLLVVIVVVSILIFLGPQLGSMFSAVTKGFS
jgi:pilus assembly protein Flp/PilA